MTRKFENGDVFYASKKYNNPNNPDNDDTIFTIHSRLQNTPTYFHAKNIFRINKADQEKAYFVPSTQSPGVRIYIKNENNINNYCRSHCHGGEHHTTPIIMPSYNNNRQRPSEFKTSMMRSNTDHQKTYFKKDYILNSRHDLAPNKKIAPKKDSIFLPKRKNIFQTVERSSSDTNTSISKIEPQLKKSFNEFSKHRRPWLIKDLDKNNNNNSKIVGDNELPKLSNNTYFDKTKSESSTAFLKKQESSNFSMFKDMNSNELGNYIDNVINQFRTKTKLLTPEATQDEEDKVSEFSDTTFYPDENERVEDDESVANKMRKSSTETIKSNPMGFIKRSLKDEIIYSESEEEAEEEDNFLKSRSLNQESNEGLEEESSTFINYTHSFELDDSDDTLDKSDFK